MATVCVTVPDDQAARIVAAVAARSGQQYATMADGIAIVQQHVFRELSESTLAYEAQQAAQAVMTDRDDPLVTATTAVQP